MVYISVINTQTLQITFLHEMHFILSITKQLHQLLMGIETGWQKSKLNIDAVHSL